MNTFLFSAAGDIFATVAVIIVILAVILFATGYVKAAPDTAIIISGMGKRKILIGKAGLDGHSYKELINYLYVFSK